MDVRKKFKIEYWYEDEQGAYLETASFCAENIVEAVQYAEDKYGSVISVKEVELFYKDEE